MNNWGRIRWQEDMDIGNGEAAANQSDKTSSHEMKLIITVLEHRWQEMMNTIKNLSKTREQCNVIMK